MKTKTCLRVENIITKKSHYSNLIQKSNIDHKSNVQTSPDIQKKNKVTHSFPQKLLTL